MACVAVVGMARSSLVYNKHNCNTTCGSVCVSGDVVVNGRRMRGYARLMCKSWNCPVCGPRKAYRLRKSIEEWSREHDLTRLLTLTLDPRKLGREVVAERYIKQVWAKFRVYLKRKLGRSVEYIAVMEYHKSGVPHLHALVSEYIPQRWISNAWSRLGGGAIVHIERVMDGGNIGRYLAKYLSKNVMLSVPKGARRYMTSRGIRLWRQYRGTG